MILQKFKILGHSMSPKLKEGSEVLVSFIPYFFSNPRVEDVIVFRKSGKILVKRIREINADKFMVGGDNIRDSLKAGWISKEDIIGKIIYKI